MTQDEVIEMARQAGMNIDVLTRCRNIELLEPFVKLVAQQAQAEEREACAKVCETQWKDSPWLIEAATAIRARGNNK